MGQSKLYKSKISYALLVPMILLCLIIWLVPIIKGTSFNAILIVSIVMLGTVGLILYTFFSTVYWINEENQLRIKVGLMSNITIPVSEITSIKKTGSWLASPAASFDRIEIFYGKWNSVMISPERKKDLVSVLLNINPNIEVDLNSL